MSDYIPNTVEALSQLGSQYMTGLPLQVHNQYTLANNLREQGGIYLGRQYSNMSYRFRSVTRTQALYAHGGRHIWVDDHGLRHRLMKGPADLAKLWRTDMGAIATKIFKPHVVRRIPIRGLSRNLWTKGRTNKAGMVTNVKARKASTAAHPNRLGGKIARTFRAFGRLEGITLTLGGKKAPYTAVLELGAIPHSTYYRAPTLRHIRGGEIKRWVGGGSQLGFGGYHMLEQGVLAGMPEWRNEYRKYNDLFLRSLANPKVIPVGAMNIGRARAWFGKEALKGNLTTMRDTHLYGGS